MKVMNLLGFFVVFLLVWVFGLWLPLLHVVRSTFPKLSAVVQRTLLSDCMGTLLGMDTGILFLLQEERIEDLQRLYRLFSLLDNGFEPIASEFKLHVLSKLYK